MSRLIDADKLIDKLIDESIYEWVDGNGKIDISYVRALIYKQPTAFDVDKVVEQLEEKIYNIDDSLTLSSRDVIDEEDVMEIVEAGGVDDISISNKI